VTAGARGGRILVLDHAFGDDLEVEREIATAHGHDLVAGQARDESQAVELMRTYDPDAVLVQFAPVSAPVLAAASRVRGVVRYGVGLDNVDTTAAVERGIIVARVADYCVEEVADHAWALLLALHRQLPALAAAVASGEWRWQAGGPIPRLRGRRLGLVGYGRIARAVAQRARASGVEVHANDPNAAEADVPLLALDDLLRASDMLSLHLPLTEETRHLLGARELALLPEGAIVVNTARGPLVDEGALLDALDSGRLAGAGLDVLAREPPEPGHPLRSHPRALVTPHAAWYSEGSILELRRRTAEAAVAILAGTYEA
jgi:D-3-phosphoglycerate dehydrogenase